MPNTLAPVIPLHPVTPSPLYQSVAETFLGLGVTPGEVPALLPDFRVQVISGITTAMDAIWKAST
jgi:hypothetical protein